MQGKLLLLQKGGVQLFRHGVIVSATKNSFFGWNLRVI